MSDTFDPITTRVRRRVLDDGTVVDERGPRETVTEVEGGRVLSLSPARVRLRTGEVVDVDGYLRTGVTPAVDDVVVVVRRGGFVLVLGEVVLL